MNEVANAYQQLFDKHKATRRQTKDLHVDICDAIELAVDEIICLYREDYKDRDIAASVALIEAITDKYIMELATSTLKL